MKNIYEVIGKKQFFALWNIVALAVMVWQGRLTWDLESILATLIALLVINGLILISAGNFPDWK
jgi:hypothetical protein